MVEDYLRRVMRQASLDGAIGGALALANRLDYSPVIEDAEVPLLAIVGIQDPVYPVAISQAMVDLAGENGTLSVIDGASHAAVFEQPGAVAAAMVDWMTGIE
jgi:pimeloyl-ACP methyl ester carboxylesterase